MQKVQRYALYQKTNVLELPKGARVVSASLMWNDVYLHILEPDTQEKEERIFLLVHHSEPVEDALLYVGTVQKENHHPISPSILLIHIFEIPMK